MGNHKISNYKKILLHLFKQNSFPSNSANNARDLFDNRKIIIYGAGSGFFTFSIFVLNKYGFKPHVILDKKFNKSTYFGIPAFSPFKYNPTEQDKKNAVVVITVGKKEYHKEIINCLSTLGFKKILLATDIYEYHLHYPSHELEKNGFGYFLKNKNKIIKCLDIFADDLSREVYVKFLQTHMLKKPITIPNSPQEEQYFPKDLKLTKKVYSRFIHCGAYQGETIRQCNKLYGKLDAVVCFEPDLTNFKSLEKYLCSERNKIAKSIVAFPCGVFSHEIQLHFSSGYEANSTISDKGNSIIQCVALDHVIPSFRPTFISMDIEGSELAALKGSEHLIRENKSNLAISVYHTPNHIWDIPLYVNSLKLDYKFYLRNYTSFISETIFYAIMKKLV